MIKKREEETGKMDNGDERGDKNAEERNNR